MIRLSLIAELHYFSAADHAADLCMLTCLGAD